MNLKNLSVKNRTHKKILNHLNKKRISKIFKNFSRSLKVKEDLAVAVSGGPDSLALAYLAQCYSLKNKLKIKFFMIDHKIRKESSLEAKKVRAILKLMGIECKVLPWNGKKPKKNISATARNKRYSLLVKECNKNNIKNLLLGHHLDDLFENFFIRILRGSGLNGLVSLDRKTQNRKINLIRPLLSFDKKDLIYISNYIFGSYVKDLSNEDDKFKRVKIRNLLKQLESEGLDRNKFLLTIKNLKFSNETIKFYTRKNLEENISFLEKKKLVVLKENFFNNSKEVIFRSFTEIIKLVGKQYYPSRGRKVDKVIQSIQFETSLKLTLGGCIIRKVNQTIIVSKE